MTSTTLPQALLSALKRDGQTSVAIVLWPVVSEIDWLISEIEFLLPTGVKADRASSVDQALQRRDQLILLVPPLADGAEAEVVADLESSRDLLLDRAQPLVLFLQRGGPGMAALREHPSLASWVSGSVVDPEALAEVDVEAERREFEATVGEAPERWLARWDAGEQDRTSVNYSRAYWAAMLVSPASRAPRSDAEPGTTIDA